MSKWLVDHPFVVLFICVGLFLCARGVLQSGTKNEEDEGD